MPEGVPTSIVVSLRGQGLTNNQIIQSLQREGYSAKQIADAMAQADLRYSIEGQPVGGAMPEYPEYGPEEIPAAPPAVTGAQEITAETIQALVETIIEEK